MYEIFAELLKKHNVTRYQVSKATGVPQSSLSDWSKGKSKPKYDNMKKIAAYFGVSVDYLLGNEEKEKPTAAKTVSDDDIKFALFGDVGVSDEDFEDVKRFAEFIKNKKKE